MSRRAEPNVDRRCRHRRLWLLGLMTAASAGTHTIATGAGAAPLAGDLASRLRELERGAARPLAPGLYLESSEDSSHTRGEVLARLELPFPAAAAALGDAQGWCALLMLHPNVKQCLPLRSAAGTLLDIVMSSQRDGLFAQEHPLQLALTVRSTDPGRLDVELFAERGPLGTRDYRIAIAMAPLDTASTVLRLVYSSAFTPAGLWMAQAYVNSVARHRIGFTVVDTDNHGRPVHVRGVRGAIERNTMRFQLAVQSWLAVQPRPPAERIPAAIEAWFDASERYAAQLHEVERAEYVARKRADFERLRNASGAEPRR
jgi:hypothetical protein